MAYVALYRTWRPQNFDSVVGQPHIVRTLTNAIEKNKIAHAYLFSGPRGTGKTSTAKILAKALNCTHGPTTDPCGTCEACRKITEGASMDVLEIDAASNRGIDEIRGLRETVGFLPVDGRYKVYIIDEVHMLTTEAFNALLKTLEEPPPHILFILATTEPHKIPATIHSRCQRYDFRRISASDIEARLGEVIDHLDLTIEPAAVRLIADAAEGGMRDALSLLDQCITTSDDTITAADVENLLGMVGHTWVARLTDHIAERNGRQTLLTFSDLLAEGKDPRQMLIELAQHLRNVLLSQVADKAVSAAADPAVLKRQAQKLEAEDLTRMIKRLYEAAQEAKYTADNRITAEVALLDLCARQYSSADLDTPCPHRRPRRPPRTRQLRTEYSGERTCRRTTNERTEAAGKHAADERADERTTAKQQRRTGKTCRTHHHLPRTHAAQPCARSSRTAHKTRADERTAEHAEDRKNKRTASFGCRPQPHLAKPPRRTR